MKKKTRGKLVKDCDLRFSRYIRQKYANEKGQSVCYTCGDRYHYKDLQCGHFITRANYKYRRDEHNCRPQCYRCNIIFSGNYKIYTLKMIEEYGKERIEYMIHDKELIKVRTFEIEEMIEKYKSLVYDY